MRRWLTWTLVASVFVLVSGAAYLGFRSARQRESTTPQAPITVAVTRGNVQQTVIAPGLLVGTRTTSLGTRAGGQIAEINVQPGDLVQVGDELVRLNVDDLMREIDQARIFLNSAELRLSEAEKALDQQTAQGELDLVSAQARLTQAGDSSADAAMQAEIALAVAQEQHARLQASRPDIAAEITTAGATLEQAIDELSRAQYEYQKAMDRSWEPQEARNAHARALQSAQWDLEIARARYDQALAAETVYHHDVNIRELAIAQAKADLAQVEGVVDPLLRLEVQQVELRLKWLSEGPDPALDNEVTQARLALERLQVQAAGARVVAPLTGVVLEVLADVGDAVAPGDGLFFISDPVIAEVQTTVIEEDLPLVQVGQPVELFFDALPNAAVRGTVTRIVPQRVRGKDRPLYHVYIASDELPESMVPGMTADASIITARRSDVLRLPKALVLAGADQTAQVGIWTGTQVLERTTQVGLRGDVYIEILDGLEEGELVVGQ